MSASGRIALKPVLDPALLKALRPAGIPAGILLATAVLAWLVPLPAELRGLQSAGPYALLAIAVALAWYFNRGRAFVVAASLLGAFGASHAFGPGVQVALAMLVPLNAAAVLLLPERGARYRAGYAWIAVLALEGLLLAGLRDFVGGADFERVCRWPHILRRFLRARSSRLHGRADIGRPQATR